MIDTRTAPYAALILRIGLGLPPALAYLTILAEVAGGVALILGFHARWAALALIPILAGAIVTVHGPAGFFFTNPKGGWEFLAFWIVALLAQALLGDCAYAVRGGSATVPGRLAARSA